MILELETSFFGPNFCKINIEARVGEKFKKSRQLIDNQ